MVGMIGFYNTLWSFFERRIDWRLVWTLWSEDLDAHQRNLNLPLKLPGSPADQNNVEHQRSGKISSTNTFSAGVENVVCFVYVLQILLLCAL